MDVMEALEPAGELYKQGKYAEALKLIQNIWNTIPEPKAAMPNAYNIIESAVATCLQMKDLDSAWEWANKTPPFKETHCMGEGEFLIGKVAFLRNDIDAARENFAIASKKSGGRIFKGKDPKFKELLKRK